MFEVVCACSVPGSCSGSSRGIVCNDSPGTRAMTSEFSVLCLTGHELQGLMRRRCRMVGPGPFLGSYIPPSCLFGSRRHCYEGLLRIVLWGNSESEVLSEANPVLAVVRIVSLQPQITDYLGTLRGCAKLLILEKTPTECKLVQQTNTWPLTTPELNTYMSPWTASTPHLYKPVTCSASHTKLSTTPCFIQLRLLEVVASGLVKLLHRDS